MTVILPRDRMYQWMLSMFIIGLTNVDNYVTGCTSITQLSKNYITADMAKGITLDKLNDKPQYAKLYNNRAFCAKIQPGFYIQVKFDSLKTITGLEIQGFEVNGTKFKVDTFLLKFSLDGNFWYQDTNGQSGVPKYFLANSGLTPQTVVKLKLPNPAIGRYVRLFPRSPQDPKEQVMCIRFQLLGCDISVPPPNIHSTRNLEATIGNEVNLSCIATGRISMVVEWNNHSNTALNVTSLRKTLTTPLNWEVSYSDLSLYKCSDQISYIKCSRNYTCQSYYGFDPNLRKESHSKVTVKILFPDGVTNFTVARKNRSGVIISWKRPSLNDLTPTMVNYSLTCNISGSMKTRLLPVTVNSRFLPTSKVYHPYQCRLKVVRNNLSHVFPFNFEQNYAVLNFRSLSIRPNVKLSIAVKEKPRGNVKIRAVSNFTEKKFGRPEGFHVLATMIKYGNRHPVKDHLQDVNETYLLLNYANNGYIDYTIVVLNKLKPWSKYQLKVSVFNNDMLLSNYSIIEIKTKEGKPQWSPTLIATSMTINTVMLKIKLPNANDRFLQNGKLTKYTLQVKLDNKILYTKEEIIKELEKRFFEVDNLIPSRNYSFRCKAATKAGYGEYGEEINVTMKAGEPGKPVEIHVKEYGKNKLLLTWKKPSKSAGIITKYEIRVTLNNSTKIIYDVNKPIPNYLHKLLPRSVKQVSIRAYTSAGAGEWSNPSTVSLTVENHLKNQSTLIIGFSVAFALFAGFVVMCFIYFRRHYQSQPHHIKEDYQLDSMLNSRDIQLFEDDLESDMYIGSTPSLHSSDTTTCNLGNTHDPIHVDDFAEYINNMKQDDYKVLLEDFKNQMPFGKCYSCDVAELPENSRKNRYLNICAYDHSRIVLKSTNGRMTSDYINANSIYGYKKWENGNYKYISTQGPTEETAADFWRMVWQEGSSIIVMLTNLKDNDKVKCAQYWPSESTKIYGNIEVTLDKIDKTADYITRTFQLVEVETKEQRTVRQFHFVPWPDHGVPDYPTALLSLRRRVRHYYEDGKPMIIHCSAGVGRSGCFILIDAMLERIDNEKTVDIFNYLNYMRTRRIYMVQTSEQYIFAHTAILEYITFGNTETFVGELDKKFKELVRGNGMAEEFALLERNKVTDHHSDIASTVLLREGMYVEAFPVDGFKQRDAFILTKAPSKENVVNFWKMVLEKQCHTIVMLNKCQEISQEYYKYWPHVDGHYAYQDIAVLLNNEVANGNIITRKIKVTTNKRRCEVNHFQFVDWPDTEVPDQRVYNNICTLMQAVEKSQHNLGNGPIIVHSGNDYGRSGTFIAIYNSTERLKVEQLIDVLQCVRAIRITQPLAVDNVNQYQFVYNMLRTYLEGFENYCNYKDYNVCRSPFGSSPRVSTHLIS